MPLERSYENVDRRNAFKVFDEISRMDYREELMIPDEYYAERDKFIKMLTKLKRMRNAASVRI